jgi:hypothetical protein
MQATARRLSVVSATSCARRRLIRNVGRKEMKLNIRNAVFLVFVAASIVAAILVVDYLQSPSFYFRQQKRMVDRVLASDPDRLLRAGRQLFQSRPGYVGEISTSSPDIPSIIRKLKPTQITFRTNSLWVDFSDVMNPFGIVVFPGRGDDPYLHKWIDGLWLFDDGQLHTNGQPDGPANGSQPIRSETNRTSTAAGSRR